jgi:hypothetical protein
MNVDDWRALVKRLTNAELDEALEGRVFKPIYQEARRARESEAALLEACKALLGLFEPPKPANPYEAGARALPVLNQARDAIAKGGA